MKTTPCAHESEIRIMRISLLFTIQKRYHLVSVLVLCKCCLNFKYIQLYFFYHLFWGCISCICSQARGSYQIMLMTQRNGSKLQGLWSRKPLLIQPRGEVQNMSHNAPWIPMELCGVHCVTQPSWHPQHTQSEPCDLIKCWLILFLKRELANVIFSLIIKKTPWFRRFWVLLNVS